MRKYLAIVGLLTLITPTLSAQTTCPTADTSAGCECEYINALDAYTSARIARRLTTAPAPAAGTCTSSKGKPAVSFATADAAEPTTTTCLGGEVVELRVAFQASFNTDFGKACRIEVIDECGILIVGINEPSNPPILNLAGGESSAWKKFLKDDSSTGGCGLAEALVP